MSEAPDVYDPSNDRDYFGGVCKVCYEDLLQEKAEKLDKEYSAKCDWPNPYRFEED